MAEYLKVFVMDRLGTVVGRPLLDGLPLQVIEAVVPIAQIEPSWGVRLPEEPSLFRLSGVLDFQNLPVLGVEDGSALCLRLARERHPVVVGLRGGPAEGIAQFRGPQR